MNVLMTGATGRLGRSFLAHAPETWKIEALLDTYDQSDIPVPWYRSSIDDRDRTIMAVTCAKPDVILHLAALTGVDYCEEQPGEAYAINRDGARNVAEAAAECGAHMILLSTDYVFDGRFGPYTEEDEPNPVNVYGRSKWEGEQAAAEKTADLCIIRISVPFGIRHPAAGHNFISRLIGELGEGNEVRAVTDQLTTPTYMDELLDLIDLLLSTGRTGLFHYGTADRLSRYDMALDVCDVFGFEAELVEPAATGEMDFRAARPLQSGFVTDRVHDVFGRPPVQFRDALYRIAEGMETTE